MVERDVGEAGGDRDVGQVTRRRPRTDGGPRLAPELVGTVNLEILRHERVDRTIVIAVGGSDETPAPPRVQVVLPHQPPNLLGVDDKAAVAEFGVDAAIAVALEHVGDGADLRDDLLVAGPALRLGVEAGPRDAHQFAPPLDGEAAGPP